MKRFLFVLAVAAAMTLRGICAESAGVMLEAVGQTWPVAEPDPVAEIQKALSTKKEVITKCFEELQQSANSYRPPGCPVVLEPAGRDYEYLVDMTYVLDRDFEVPDEDGKKRVLYPAGYGFNVLDYVPLDRTYVVFDGTDPCEVRFVEKTYGRDPNVKLLAANGMTEAEKVFPQGRVAWLIPEIAKVFHLEATVSAISRRGKDMAVKVYRVDRHCKESSDNNPDGSPACPSGASPAAGKADAIHRAPLTRGETCQ
jgi:hypothetical protein